MNQILFVAAIIAGSGMCASAWAASPEEAECAAMTYVLREKADVAMKDFLAAKRTVEQTPSPAAAEHRDVLAFEASSLDAIATDLSELYDGDTPPAEPVLSRLRGMPAMTLREIAIDCFP